MNNKELEELHKKATGKEGLKIMYEFIGDTIFKKKQKTKDCIHIAYCDKITNWDDANCHDCEEFRRK